MERILLSLEDPGELARLRAWLERDYALITVQGEAPAREPFDLALVDYPGWARLRAFLEAARKKQEPVWLPALLVVTSPEEPSQVAEAVEDTDDLIYAPIKELELRTRVKNLLRLRRLSRQVAEGRQVLEAEQIRGDTTQRQSETNAEELLVAQEELEVQNEELQNQAAELEERSEELYQLNLELQQEKDFLSAIVQQLPGGVIIAAAPSGDILLASKGAEQIWRRPLGRLEDIEPSLDSPAFGRPGHPAPPHDRPLRCALTTGEVFSNEELLVTHPDGTRTVINVNAAPIRDREGSLVAAVATFTDLTRQKNTEAALRKVNDQLEGLIRTAPLAIISLDLDNRVTSWNPAAERFFGWSRDEVLGRPLPVVPPDELERFRSIREADRQGEVVSAAEVPALRKDGARIEISLSTAPVYDESGKIMGSMGIAEDITRRKETEAALRAAGENLRAMINAFPLAVIALDAEGKVMSWNPAAERIFGWRAAEVIDVPLPCLPEDQAAEFQTLLARVQQGEIVAGVETRRRRRDGSPVYVSLSLAPFRDEGGKIVGSVGIIEDITARKEVEEALVRANEEWERTFNAVPDLMAILDRDHHIMRTNRAMAALLGEEPEHLVGRHCYEVVHQRTEPPPVCPHVRLLKDGAEHSAEICEFNRELLVTTSPLTDSAGHVIGSVHLARDITQQKKTQEALRRQAELLDLAHDAILVRDLQNRIVFWSHGAEEAYGWTREEAMGQKSHELLKTEFPQPLEQIETELLKVGRWDGELVHTTKSGQKVVMAGRWALHQGEPPESARILEINTDITVRRQAEAALHRAYEGLEQRVEERTADLQRVVAQLQEEVQERLQAEEAFRESEERFASFMKYLPGAAIMRDVQGRYVFANETWEKIFGKKLSACRGKTLNEVWDADHAALFLDLDRKVIQTKKPVEEITQFPTAGGKRYLLATRFPILNPAGEVVMVGGIGIDVTDRRLAEEALGESERKLRFLTSQLFTIQERERSRLSRELHDGLGQTLLVYKLHLRAIERNLPPDRLDLLENCRDALAHIDEIIEDIRRLSRDLSPSVLEDIGLEAAIKNLCDDFSRLQGFECSLAVDPAIRDLSQEAQINIYRIIQESLANISKYAHATRVEVAAHKEDGKFVFAIRDNGCGFDPAEALARGSLEKGMGLAAMTERVRMLGGTLQISSREGEGTRIEFTIPSPRKLQEEPA